MKVWILECELSHCRARVCKNVDLPLAEVGAEFPDWFNAKLTAATFLRGSDCMAAESGSQKQHLRNALTNVKY